MSAISAADAFAMLAKWAEQRAAIQLAISRSARQQTASVATVVNALPHSQKVLVTLRDEHGKDVGVTVSLAGATWEYEKGGGTVPEFPAIQWRRHLAASFPDGSRYILGECAAEP